MKKGILLVLITCGITYTGHAQLAIGSAVPEISLPNVKDSMVNLSSFKGKVVLVDFWASWCVPCRASNPGVVRIYKKYKDKGFEVFAVSIDVKKPAWLKAIRQDKLPYTLVNDASGWYSKVAEAYFVNEIPTSFLLDATGKLVAVDAEGAQLEKLLNGLLK